jgi:hypothetical protein
MNEYSHHLNKLRTLQDVVMCKEDTAYFIEKYVQIEHPSKGPIPFALYDYQKQMITSFDENKYIAVNAARQTGSTITTLAYLFAYAIKNPERNIMVFVPKDIERKDIIYRLGLMADRLPKDGSIGVEKSQHFSRDIEFTNGTRIMVCTAHPSAARGMALDVVYFEGFDRIDRKTQEELYYSLLPCIVTTSGKFIINMCGGTGLAREIFEGAVKKENKFIPMHIRWDMPPSRDEAFKRETIKMCGEDEWKHYYECGLKHKQKWWERNT